jgi:hypothetical protein
MSNDKKTEGVKVWLSEPVELELRRLADLEDRKLSDYIGWVLRRHVYGHAIRLGEDTNLRPPGD